MNKLKQMLRQPGFQLFLFFLLLVLMNWSYLAIPPPRRSSFKFFRCVNPKNRRAKICQAGSIVTPAYLLYNKRSATYPVLATSNF